MSAADLLTARWTADMHAVAELERDCAYAAGYARGRADERADIEAAGAALARSPYPPHLAPTAEQVVRDLVARLTAESRPLNTPPPGSHPGGPVAAWGADE